MGQDKAGIAIARIERALARIEAAASRPAPPPSYLQGADSEAADELRRAHLALRSRVQSAISDLDGLLADEERG